MVSPRNTYIPLAPQMLSRVFVLHFGQEARAGGCDLFYPHLAGSVSHYPFPAPPIGIPPPLVSPPVRVKEYSEPVSLVSCNRRVPLLLYY